MLTPDVVSVSLSVPELAAAAPSLLQRLRGETAEAHRALDASLDFSPAALDRARYATFVLGTWMVVNGLEPALIALLGADALPALDRSRRDTLVADLHALGVALPPAPAVPIPGTVAAAWGAAYVVEGSSLGGVVLARRVRDALGEPIARAATGYLRLRGDRTKAAWTAFQASLAAFDAQASHAERAEACACASATFDAYTAAFVRSGALTGCADGALS